MISKQFELINYDDLQALLENEVPESKTLEYKRDLPDNTEKSKNAFLAAITSFANTEGGDLLYGIRATDAVPLQIHGIGEVIDDELKLRLESMSRTGIEPRLPKLELKLIQAPNGKVLLVRVAKSWAAPHRVTIRESGPFYARHSSGKYELDVAELRTAFALSSTISQRIESFHGDRVERIRINGTPTPIRPGCKMVVHIIPLSAFSNSEIIDVRFYGDKLREFHPLGRTHFQQYKFNLEGVLDYANPDTEGRSSAYTQIFRSGIVEAVYVFSNDADEMYIHSRIYESHVWSAVQRYLGLLGEIEVSAPFYVYLSFIGINAYKLRIPSADGMGYVSATTDRHLILLPEIVVTDTNKPAHELLRPAFDMVWNAFGYAGSQNYDVNGNWIANAGH